MNLPKNEKTFYFSSVGAITSKKYEGDFTVICIVNMMQKRAIELEKTRLQADTQNPTDGLFGISLVLANLRHRILSGPSWWQDSAGGFLIQDENTCLELYNKVLEQENLWKQELKEKSEPKDETLGETNTERK